MSRNMATRTLFLLLVLLVNAPRYVQCSEDEMYCGEENCYDVLGVSRGDTNLAKLVKKNYRKLSLQYHPDKNPDPDASDKFVAISTAYGVLSNDDQREAYDYYLDHPQEAMYNKYRFYQTKYAPRTDFRVAIVVLLVFVSFSQFVFQIQEHNRMVVTMRESNQVTSAAKNLAAQESTKSARLVKKDSDVLNTYIDQVIEAMYAEGTLVKPKVSNILIFQLLKLPFRLPDILRWLNKVKQNREIEAQRHEASRLEAEYQAQKIEEENESRKLRKQAAVEKRLEKARIEREAEERKVQEEILRKNELEEEAQSRKRAKRKLLQIAKTLKNVDGLAKDIETMCNWEAIDTNQILSLVELAIKGEGKVGAGGSGWVDKVQEFAKDYSKLLEKKTRELSEQLDQLKTDRKVKQSLPWDDRELAMLSKGAAKFPGGTKNRWQMIATYVNSAGVGNDRDAQQCISRYQSVRKGPLTKKSSDQLDESKAEDEWSAEQQRKLEEGLQKFPASMEKKERWTGIASVVPGKSAKQCALRYKHIRSLIKAKV